MSDIQEPIDTVEVTPVDAPKPFGFIGEKEVKSVEGTLVTFVDDTTVTLTETQAKYMVTPEPKDLTAMRNLLLDNIVPDMLKVLTDHDIKKGDMQAVLNTTVGSYNRAFNVAIGKAFGTYDENESPEYYPERIKMSDIIRINEYNK